MIRTVRIRGFKRFREVEFQLPGHLVRASPDNAGKTTLPQAIAAWSLASRRWREVDGCRRAPIARQAFATVPRRGLDLR